MSSSTNLSRVAGRRIESVEASTLRPNSSLVALKLTLDDGSELHINAHLYGDDPAFEAEHVTKPEPQCPHCPGRAKWDCILHGCATPARDGEHPNWVAAGRPACWPPGWETPWGPQVNPLLSRKTRSAYQCACGFPCREAGESCPQCGTGSGATAEFRKAMDEAKAERPIGWAHTQKPIGNPGQFDQPAFGPWDMADTPRACPRCGLVAGCACERGA